MKAFPSQYVIDVCLVSTLWLTDRQYEMQSYNFTLAKWKEKAINTLVFFGIQLGKHDSAIMDIMAQWFKHQYAEHQGNVSPDKCMDGPA